MLGGGGVDEAKDERGICILSIDFFPFFPFLFALSLVHNFPECTSSSLFFNLFFPFLLLMITTTILQLTVIPEAQFTRDPLGSIDAVVEDLLCWTHAGARVAVLLFLLKTVVR